MFRNSLMAIVKFWVFVVSLMAGFSGASQAQMFPMPTPIPTPTPTPTPGPSPADAQANAASQTAQSNSRCRNAQPFYWEIGDGAGKRASGTAGGNSPTETTSMLINSASKLVFAAYVAQVRGGQLTQEDISALTMRAGYTNTDYDYTARTTCILSTRYQQDALTVHQCFTSSNMSGGRNSDYNSNAVGRFYYNGGNFQWLADARMGLGSKNNASLKRAIAEQVGSDFDFTYDSPQVADGMKATAKSYAIFLRKILNRKLHIFDYLGAYAICTNPDTCSDAMYRPIPSDLNYEYSVGHFVETDPSEDGAFTSPGWRGFYPWIDATKQYYGILARDVNARDGNVVTDSVLCGSAIRKAWVTSTAQ